MKREISVFSLSLLDLLFCAFGGVIVLTVVFSAIIKYEQAASVQSDQIALSLQIDYERADDLPKFWQLEILNTKPTVNVPIDRVRENRENLSRIFKDFTFFEKFDQSRSGHFSFGLEGDLRKSETQVKDTLYVTLTASGHDPTKSKPVWNNPGGEIMIRTLIYKGSDLPEERLLIPFNAQKLSNYNQAIPLLLTSLNGELKIDYLSTN